GQRRAPPADQAMAEVRTAPARPRLWAAWSIHPRGFTFPSDAPGPLLHVLPRRDGRSPLRERWEVRNAGILQRRRRDAGRYLLNSTKSPANGHRNGVEAVPRSGPFFPVGASCARSRTLVSSVGKAACATFASRHTKSRARTRPATCRAHLGSRD